MIELTINCFLWYIFYSVIGWITETLIFAIRDKNATKRGFLFGPLCPIYGTGAVMCRLILDGKFANLSVVPRFIVLFIVGALLCDAMEYVTSYVMEKAFHAKWWDYSNQKFNIKGRICLFSTVLFGGGVAILVMWIQPAVEAVTMKIPFNVRAIVAFIIYSILIVDVALTIQSLKDIVRSLQEIEQYAVDNVQAGIDKTDERLDNFVEKIKTTEISTDIFRRKSHIDDVISELDSEKSQFRKIRHLFPKVHFERYGEAEKMIASRQKEKNKEENEKD